MSTSIQSGFSQGEGEEHSVLERVWISSCRLYEIPALIHEHTESMAKDEHSKSPIHFCSSEREIKDVHHSRVTVCFPRIVIPGSFLDAFLWLTLFIGRGAGLDGISGWLDAGYCDVTVGVYAKNTRTMKPLEEMHSTTFEAGLGIFSSQSKL